MAPIVSYSKCIISTINIADFLSSYYSRIYFRPTYVQAWLPFPSTLHMSNLTQPMQTLSHISNKRDMLFNLSSPLAPSLYNISSSLTFSGRIPT